MEIQSKYGNPIKIWKCNPNMEIQSNPNMEKKNEKNYIFNISLIFNFHFYKFNLNFEIELITFLI